MNCIIADDEPSARKAIQKLVDQTDNLESIGSFKVTDTVTKFLSGNKVDLIFFDTQMSGVNRTRKNHFEKY